MALLLMGVAALALTVVALAIAIARAPRRPRKRRSRKWLSAGGLVIDARGRIALVRQRNRRGRWHWTLPKGRIDRGETVEAAALREVYEETGLRARIVRPIVLHEGRLHFTQFFEMTVERDDGQHDSETKEMRMVTFAEAAGMLRRARDLRVLQRVVEMRTRVVSIAAAD
jgi:ADP-ribose pyrophosphatase YjhB (NUDIX family)